MVEREENCLLNEIRAGYCEESSTWKDARTIIVGNRVIDPMGLVSFGKCGVQFRVAYTRRAGCVEAVWTG